MPTSVSHVPTFTGFDPVDAARKVLNESTCAIFDDVLLDTFTASAIVAVFERVNVANQNKLRAMSLTHAADVCFKIASKS